VCSHAMDKLNQTQHALTLDQQFSAIAATYPDKIALRYHEKSMTYRELDEKSTQLAVVIRRLYDCHYKIKLPENTLIGLHINRGFNLIIGLLGILKSGAAYVALPCDYPKARLMTFAEDAKLTFVVTEQANNNMWLNIDKYFQTICVDTYPANTVECPTHFDNINTPDSLAYVLYTSGSTGKPKGVKTQHKAVSCFVQSQKSFFTTTSNDRIVQFANIGFDASVWEWATALFNGASLVLMDNPAQMSFSEIREVMYKNQVTTTLLPPVVLREFKEKLPALHTLLVGGDVCDTRTLHYWCDRERQLFNVYGPTETTAIITLSLYQLGDSERQLGIAMRHVQTYVLDEDRQPVVVGMPGELYVSGGSLSCGYLNNPELTTDSFIDNPFWNKEDPAFAKLYRTGDIVKYDKKGLLHYIGRRDNQVKLRGMRVELDEIKYVIEKHPLVKTATVITDDNQRLLGFFEIYSDAPIFSIDDEKKGFYHGLVNSWQNLYDELYAKTLRCSPLKISQHFNPIGWQSSYTSEAIASQEMLEWRDNTVERILALQPKRVLEIGCGTGILLFEIAPHCQHYVATDFSPVALNTIHEKLQAAGLHHIVDLQLQNANVFDRKHCDAYDVIIINSVIQYFPDQDYLTEVLNYAVQYINQSGTIFIGDIRSYIHAKPFYALTAWHKTSHRASIAVLKQQYQQLLLNEKELLVHHDYFHQFAKDVTGIDYIEWNLKKGNYANEMNQFRYDVILHVGNVNDLNFQPVIEKYRWHIDQDSEQYFNQLLAKMSGDALIIEHMPNQRLRQSYELLAKLNNESANQAQSVIAPATLFTLADRYQLNLNLMCSSTEPVYRMDAVFSKKKATQSVLSILYQQLQNHFLKQKIDKNLLTNHPSAYQVQQVIKQKLYQYIRKQLPDYMSHIKLFVIDQWPLTVNNKINREQLLAIAAQQPKTTAVSNDPVEQAVIQIWQEVLYCSSISLDDNFFELGGHSLSAMKVITKLSQHFNIKLSVRAIFDCTTARQLSHFITEKLLGQAKLHTVSSPLVLLNKAGQRCTLFARPPITGSIFCYVPLSQFMFNISICAMQDPGLLNGQQKQCFTTLEQLATYYREYIRRQQPKGSYYLVGYSFGGLVAIEIARQLQALRESVSFLGLVDTWPVTSTHINEQYIIDDILTLQDVLGQTDHAQDANNFHKALIKQRLKLGLAYQLQQPLSEIHVVLFKARDASEESTKNSHLLNLLDNYLTNVKVETVPGRHETILAPENVKKLAARLQYHINATLNNESINKLTLHEAIA
jgi:amino acid adenylation domain-containing protein